jgi:tetratricopeptide (TPR) repeat protein
VSGIRRRARLSLWAGGALFAVLAAAVLLLRARPAPYTPGADAGAHAEITRALDRDLPADVPRIRFHDAAAEAGIRFRHFPGRRSTQLPEDMGSGAAWGDYDGDGDPDLFLVNFSGPLGPDGRCREDPAVTSRLFRNDGGRFADVTEAAGIAAPGCGMGAAWGDYDGDGRLDLAVTRYGTSLLYRNRGDGTFEDVSGTSGVGQPEGFWTGAAWADYDRDGDLDLHVCGYVRYRVDPALTGKTSLQYRAQVPYTLNPSSYAPERNLLFRNDGGRFAEVAKAAGVDNPTGRSLSGSWADFDRDGWPDLYVANDISDNVLYRNQGDGTFRDVSHAAWVADYRGAMGLGVGDWDNDLDLDIFVTHWIAQENALYENQAGTPAVSAESPVRFLDNADMHGLGQIALDFIGWGTAFLDYDNDGRLDLFVVNGSTFQRDDDPARLVPMRNLLFWNGGRERGFFEAGAAAGPDLAAENVGRGAAFADYDGDGDEDVLVMVHGGTPRLLRSDGGAAAGGFLRVVLRGPERAAGSFTTTTFATGARVTLTAGGVSQVREIGAGPSYLGQSPPGEALFGIGAAERVDRLEVAWPDGTTAAIPDLPSRATVVLVEGGEPEIRAGGAGGAADRRAAVVRFWAALNEATMLRMRGDFRAAAAAYDGALAIDPFHEDALYYLGQCRLEIGDNPGARAAFGRLVAANPRSARGHQALGMLLSVPGDGSADLKAAEAHFRQAHTINAEETGPMVRLGEILILTGRDAEASDWLASAARTNPKSVEAAFLSGYLAWRAGQRARASDWFARTVAAGRADAPIRGVLGEGDRAAAPGAPTATSPAAAASAVSAPAAQPTPAPPLFAAMGRTLFGAAARGALAAAAERHDAPVDLDAIYTPVRSLVDDLARRLTANKGSRGIAVR